MASSEAGSAAGTSRRWSLGSTRGRCVERIPSWSDPRRRAVHGIFHYAWYAFVREGFIVSSRAPKVVLARTSRSRLCRTLRVGTDFFIQSPRVVAKCHHCCTHMRVGGDTCCRYGLMLASSGERCSLIACFVSYEGRGPFFVAPDTRF